MSKLIKPIIYIKDSQCPLCLNLLCIKEISVTMYKLDLFNNANQEYTISRYETYCPVCGYKPNYNWIPTKDGFMIDRKNKKNVGILEGNLDLSKKIINKTVEGNPLGDNHV